MRSNTSWMASIALCIAMLGAICPGAYADRRDDDRRGRGVRIVVIERRGRDRCDWFDRCEHGRFHRRHRDRCDERFEHRGPDRDREGRDREERDRR